MAVYRPKYRDKKTGKMVESAVWWSEFSSAGKRYRDSTKQTLKTLALEVEKDERRKLERALVLADSALGHIRQDGDAARSATHARDFSRWPEA